MGEWLRAAGNIRARLDHVFNKHSQACGPVIAGLIAPLLCGSTPSPLMWQTNGCPACVQVLNLLMGPGAEVASKQLTPAQRTAVAAYRQAKLRGEGRFLALDPYLALFYN